MIIDYLIKLLIITQLITRLNASKPCYCTPSILRLDPSFDINKTINFECKFNTDLHNKALKVTYKVSPNSNGDSKVAIRNSKSLQKLLFGYRADSIDSGTFSVLFANTTFITNYYLEVLSTPCTANIDIRLNDERNNQNYKYESSSVNNCNILIVQSYFNCSLLLLLLFISLITVLLNK